MPCPHSSQSGPCSQCAGATPRVVTIQDGITYVDSVPVSTDGETATQTPQPRSTKHRYGKRRK